MQIALFGGTGKTGLEILKQGFELGHSFRVLVRNRATLEANLSKDQLNRIEIIEGQVTNQQDVDSTVKGQQVVINTLGPGRGNLNSTVCSDSQRVINTAITNNASSCKRLIVVTSLGVNESYTDCSWLTRFFIWAVISKPIADKCTQETLVRLAFGSNAHDPSSKTATDFVFVRPTGLTDTPKTESVIAAESGISGGRVARADVAWFILNKLLQDPAFAFKGIQITGK